MFCCYVTNLRCWTCLRYDDQLEGLNWFWFFGLKIFRLEIFNFESELLWNPFGLRMVSRLPSLLGEIWLSSSSIKYLEKPFNLRWNWFDSLEVILALSFLTLLWIFLFGGFFFSLKNSSSIYFNICQSKQYTCCSWWC